MNISHEDTICAIATAQGGAIGIIRVSGPNAITYTSNIFCPLKTGKLLEDCKAYTQTYGNVVDADGSIVDEVLVSLFRAPHSYTGEDSTEISCHGSAYILQRILKLLIKQGCRLAKPGEYTQRAFLNGKMDLSQAEAVADLIASTSSANHRLAMNQMRGGFSQKLTELRDELLKFNALIELELDFSDHEDIEFADRTQLKDLADHIEKVIYKLVDSFQLGNAIKHGVPVAIIGETNAGKSTLLNALLGEDRAIVSEISGTTRDVIEDTINIEGITFRFIDTAGIRHTDDTIENLGIERSIAAAQRAQIILMMTVPGTPYPDIPVRNDQTVIAVINKSDLLSGAGDPSPITHHPLPISAKYGVGLDQLRQQLIDAAPQTSDSDVIVSNARHYDALTRASEHLQRVLDGLDNNLSGDLLAEDLRLTLDTLAEITGGQITPNEVLGNIFSHFCVGK